MVICAGGSDFEWPDVGNDEVPCCDGSAMDGPTGCTCWRPVYDLEQTDPLLRPPGLRSRPCDDCAYRGGSPERQGDEHVTGDADLLETLVDLNRPFFCHQGIRRPVEFRHPSGQTWRPEAPQLEANYCPPIEAGVPYKADGTPADLCAGWAAGRLRRANPAVGRVVDHQALADELRDALVQRWPDNDIAIIAGNIQLAVYRPGAK